MCSQTPDRRVFAVLEVIGSLTPCCCVCPWFIRLSLSRGLAARRSGDSHQGLYFSVSGSLLRPSSIRSSKPRPATRLFSFYLKGGRLYRSSKRRSLFLYRFTRYPSRSIACSGACLCFDGCWYGLCAFEALWPEQEVPNPGNCRTGDDGRKSP